MAPREILGGMESLGCAKEVQDLNVHAVLIDGERCAPEVDNGETKFLFLHMSTAASEAVRLRSPCCLWL